jgi:hypothetical protein
MADFIKLFLITNNYSLKRQILLMREQKKSQWVLT